MNSVKKFFYRPYRACRSVLGILRRNILFSNNPVEPRKVFFRTYDGDFTCNPAAITRELLKRGKDIDIVWAIGKGVPRDHFPEGVRTVPVKTMPMFREHATARVLVDNALNMVWEYMPKKKTQICINTWHGSMGIKKIRGNRTWMFRARQLKRKTDYLISNSKFENMVYRGTFWPETPILEYGHPRNDMLFDEGAVRAAAEEVRAFYGMDPAVKICLYAPTFRDDGDLSCFNMDYARLQSALTERFGGEWAVLVRPHFKNRKHCLADLTPDWLYDGALFPDMQKLMAAADLGITDYSSWAYDYLLLKRPMLLYIPDVKAYYSERGFYFAPNTTPFPCAENNDELEAAIRSFEDEAYLAACNAFLEEKGCVEDGHAAERAADLILGFLGLL